MSTCFKCGCEIQSGVECDACVEGRIGFIQINEAQERAIREVLRRFRSERAVIDWDKVNSFADLKAIFQAFYAETRLCKGSAIYIALERFLKPDKQNPEDKS